MKVKTGDIIAFNTKFKANKISTYLSLAIRKIAKTKYNHTGVIVYVWGIPMVYESMGSGFKSIPLKDRLDDIYHDDIAILRRSDVDIDEHDFAKRATKMLGHINYDVAGLFDQAIYSITKKWKGRTEKEASDTLYCWEAVMKLHKDSNIFNKWWEIDPYIFFNNDKFEYILELTNINSKSYNKLVNL